MAFTVQFYKFSKRENSTATPTGNGTSFSCILKENSSIVDPTIILNLGTTVAPDMNYAYIPAYARWYKITEWTWVQHRLWEASLTCDVLATYKDEIGASSLYVLRSQSTYDGTIVDTLYPTKTTRTFSRASLASLFDALDSNGRVDVSEGCFCIGLVGNGSNITYGSINYYILDNTNMNSLISQLVTLADSLSIDGITGDVQKTLVDPFQYIVSCVWLPLDDSHFYFNPVSKTNVSYYTFSISGVQGYKLGTNPVGMNGVSVSNIARHPQESTKGSFLRMAPFTECSLFVPPFGHIALDPSIVANVNYLDLFVHVSAPDGMGNLYIMAPDGSMVKYLTGQVGVPISLTQITRDVIGGTVSAAGAIGSLFSGDFLGALAGVGNAAESFMPKAETKGATGAFADIYGPPAFEQIFTTVADDNLPEHGRPLMQIKQISTLSGYILCEQGDVSINGTAREAAQIKSYLESGFYYE